MSLKSLSRIPRTLEFRLTLWYSTIFILSTLVLFILSYVLLSTSIQDNREIIRRKLGEYLALYKDGGLAAIKEKVVSPRRTSRDTSFFVRVVDTSDATVFLSSTNFWKKFDLTRLEGQRVGWLYLPSTRNEEVLEILSADLPDGYRLQVGKSKESREEILEDFRETFAAVMIPLILTGFAGGAFLAFRALRPIRNLVQVTQLIVNTGSIDARVPSRQTGDELDELVRLFNRMLERIEDLIKKMREALDNVAHDLRTPMTRLRGIADITLQSGSNLEDCREALADCLEESERALTMLNTLMDISEAEAGAMKLHLEAIKISPLIRSVVDLYEHVADDKGITITVNCAEEISLIADRSRIGQVVANLLDNALKYTPGGGRVEIEALQRGRQVAVLFRDTGVGIPPEDLPRIWERLYRGDKSRSQRGLGLGLSLVKAVVQAHQGHIEASGNPGGGSIFALYLPLAPAI